MPALNLQNAKPPAAAVRAQGSSRPTMRESLKLDRRIVMLDNDCEVWPNAYRMWSAYPDSMTSAQQDRLTRQLYAAAKAGERAVITVNEKAYCLLHVDGQPSLEGDE